MAAEQILKRHDMIMQALARRDRVAAEARTREHIQDGLKFILNKMR